MERKKLKITIEAEGQPTQILEANGLAAALLGDGEDEKSHKLSVLICGRMNTQDLLHLHDGVEGELLDAIGNAVIKEMSPMDMLKILMRGRKHEPER